MKAKITKISKSPSNYGGVFYYVFFWGFDGKKYRSCVASGMRNFVKWEPIIEAVKIGKTVVLDNLRLIKSNDPKHSDFIDADSRFILIKDGVDSCQVELFGNKATDDASISKKDARERIQAVLASI